MIDNDEYLEAEFRRYFPTATEIMVGAGDDDELIVSVTLPNAKITVDFHQTNVGDSDADYFVFENELNLLPLTVPFNPEEL